MLAGADCLMAIFRWGRRLPPEALKLLGFPDGVAPCHATYHDVFQSIDGDALSRCLGSFAQGVVVEARYSGPYGNYVRIAMPVAWMLPTRIWPGSR